MFALVPKVVRGLPGWYPDYTGSEGVEGPDEAASAVGHVPKAPCEALLIGAVRRADGATSGVVGRRSIRGARGRKRQAGERSRTAVIHLRTRVGTSRSRFALRIWRTRWRLHRPSELQWWKRRR